MFLRSFSLLNRAGNRLRFAFSKSFSKSPLSAWLQRYEEPFNPNNQRMPRLDSTLDQHVLRSNSMITTLGQDGRIFEAQKLFDEIPDPDVITWTALISAYVGCGMVQEARDLFDRADAKRNVVTWTAMINGYVKAKRVFEAEMLFESMPEKNVVSWNTMLDGYVKCGMVDRALRLFERMEEPNVVSWNVVLSGLVQSGRMGEAMQIFSKMEERNLVSWTVMVAGLSKNERADEARALFERMPIRNAVSWNTMISGYARNYRMDEAFDLFKKMSEKDISSWNVMISGFVLNGDLRRASDLFNETPEKNVVSWTSLINGYVLFHQSEDALYLFSEMLQDGKVRPNERTFSSALVACGDLAALNTGKQIHQLISKTVHQGSDFVISSLISMYSKCGELSMARKAFDGSSKTGKTQDLVSWNSMIAAYAHHGFAKEAIELFQELRILGLCPNGVTFVGILSACSHSGFIEEGFRHFEMLVNDSSVKLRAEHFACLVDLCSRAGRFREAFDFIHRLPVKASEFVWGALFAGCNVHEDAKRGKIAAEKLLNAKPGNYGSSTVLLSNMYTSSMKWQDAAELRKAMREHGLKKQPGCSWTEIGSQVRVFAVGLNGNCSETVEIHSFVTNLHSMMKTLDQFLAENEMCL